MLVTTKAHYDFYSTGFNAFHLQFLFAYERAVFIIGAVTGLVK